MTSAPLNTATSNTAYPSQEEARHALQTGTGAGIKVAIIDSGVENSHLGLKINLVDDLRFELSGVSVVARPNNGHDVFGHGTAVAGLIKSIAPDAQIGSFGVLNGELKGKSVVLAAGVRAAIRQGYHILNCSFGHDSKNEIHIYKKWVDEAMLAGCHLVTACSNEYFDKEEWPAFFGTVLATNFARGQKTGEFFYRPGKMVSLAAPARDIEVLWNGGRKSCQKGSSFAAPQLAGYLARLLEKFPNLSPFMAKELLHKLASPWRDALGAENAYSSEDFRIPLPGLPR